MKLKRSIFKAKGQITIFLALVFFVLFSIFGMTISMGMFIHDKINLQNATDLASYYVAGKQAEMLTAIAHSNYQIRQSWKLLAFRYRVHGNGSRTTPIADYHPAIGDTPSAFLGDHSAYEPAKGTTIGGIYRPPRVCMFSSHIFKEGKKDNLCKKMEFAVSYVPQVPSIIPIGIVGVTNTSITNANIAIGEQCGATAYTNWWYANTIVGAHKLEQRDRRATIEALAANLALPIAPGGMKDLEGKDVYEGARKTFLYNLSESNREDPVTAVINIKNSMEGLDPGEWLKPIYVNLSVPFSTFTDVSGCDQQLANHMEDTSLSAFTTSPALTSIANLTAALDPSAKTKAAGEVVKYSDDLYNITVGVEKNPWYMVYNKIESNAISKPLFLSSIFGTGINMKSIAYAKPFGGRVGPWYQRQWPSGSDTSSSGDRTDPLLPPRVDEAGIGAFDPALYGETLFPNFSRHPAGDADGLTTKSSMVAYGRIVGTWFDGTNLTVPVADVPVSVYHYVRAVYSYFNGDYNDPLAQNTGSAEPWNHFNRRMEIAAIAPDIFDVTYYTIIPGFYDYFIKDKLDQWLPSQMAADTELRGDIGAHGEGPPEIQSFDIIDQLKIDTLSISEDATPRPREAPWLKMSNGFAYLTSWIQGEEVMNYDAADQGDVKDRFANCVTPLPDGRVKIPSECLKGGRSGYSVKMISKKYLEADDHPIGGEGGAGALLNVY